MSPSPKKLAAVVGITAAALIFTCVVFGGRDPELAAKGDDLDAALAAERLEKTDGPAASPGSQEPESFELAPPANNAATDPALKTAPKAEALKAPAKSPKKAAVKAGKKSAKKGVKAGKRRAGAKHAKVHGKKTVKKHGKAKTRRHASVKKHGKARHKRAHA